MNQSMSKVADMVTKYGAGRDACIKIPQEIQDAYGYLPAEALRDVTEHTRITLRQIYGVATFYEWFRFKPVGRHVIRTCHGTACHVNGAKHTTRAIGNNNNPRSWVVEEWANMHLPCPSGFR